jgi:PPM family protein phosphatase
VDLSDVAVMRCAACRATLAEGDLFCEQCGARVEEEESSDRIEVDFVAAAGVSDRGRVHRRNEDAFHLEVLENGAVSAVVCDGISTASSGDVAASTAARAAGTVLIQGLRDPNRDGSNALADAVQAAQDSVEQVRWTRRTGRGLPSCTLVAAWYRENEIVVGSVGDSRAYWVAPGDVRQLTVDDSWATEQVADGALTVEQALRDPRAHSITNWVGADAPERSPRLTQFRPQATGRLLLCSDGLWNYAATTTELADLIAALPPGASAAGMARALTDTAVLRGGRDNITVVVIDVDAT